MANTDVDPFVAHELGLAVARRVAEWHIGDASWADLIIGAYRDPNAARDALAEEMGESD